ncbi:MAG: hypothetical protein P4M13_03415 [Alphaproteobacteria bacterium]|nr:hypothetical protein [Alphaproteobacteria bacterium]
MSTRHRIFPAKPHRSGFTLTEIAIVLGVIGGIVGGLFALIAPLQSKIKLNQAVDELSVISNNVRSYYSGRAVPSPAACPAAGPAFAAATETQYVSSGIFPSEMLFKSGANTYVNNSWNPASTTSTVQVDLCGSRPVLFVIRYKNLTQQACLTVVPQTSGLASGMNLQKIVVTNGTTPYPFSGTIVLDPTDSTLATACTPAAAGGTITSVDWYYKLNG